MKSFLFHTAAGVITQVGACDDASYAVQTPPAGSSILELATPPADAFVYIAGNFVNNGTVAARGAIAAAVSAATITADGTTVASITGLPDPCTVSLTGVQTVAPTVVTGGTIEITANAPGTIAVSVTADPAYLPWSTTIDAV